MKEIFMLTISSQLFRIVLVMHFTRTSEFEQLVIDALKLNTATLDQDKFYDFLAKSVIVSAVRSNANWGVLFRASACPPLTDLASSASSM